VTVTTGKPVLSVHESITVLTVAFLGKVLASDDDVAAAFK
jgi:hypothetical protein